MNSKAPNEPKKIPEKYKERELRTKLRIWVENSEIKEQTLLTMSSIAAGHVDGHDYSDGDGKCAKN